MAKEQDIPGGFRIPHPADDRLGEARAGYSLYYTITELRDSPQETRNSMIARMRSRLIALPEGSTVLDVGAGRQVLEYEYAGQFAAFSDGVISLDPASINFHAIDIAEIAQDRLFASGYANVKHFEGSATQLPHDDASVSLAVSNMALDFMPYQAISELHRVLQPGAPMLLNLHHPDMLSKVPTTDRKAFERILKNRDWEWRRYRGVPYQPTAEEIVTLDTLRFWEYLADNQLLYNSHDKIEEVFDTFGFVIDDIRFASAVPHKWWEVDARKPF